MPGSCFLRVVLFADGVGADAAAYRPSADVTQWWNRRDALVRCVAAFLCGPSAPAAANGSRQKELVILFDQDWTCLHMEYNHGKDHFLVVPTERNVISLWKRAALNPGTRVEQHGLTCQLVAHASSTDPSSLNTMMTPSANSSKREILEHLQSTCSMDFLRENRLNSSSDVLLRKTNKTKLLAIARKWTASSNGDNNSSNNTPAESSNQDRDYSVLETILERLLQPHHSDAKTVIAATLHESSDDELPCWDGDGDGDDTHTSIGNTKDGVTIDDDGESLLQICLFLGAVRDMRSAETDCLRRVVEGRRDDRHHNTSVSPPRLLLQIRLGPTPEFTSKILTVVAFHHAHHRLGPAVQRMMLFQQQQARPTTTVSESLSSSPSFLPTTSTTDSYPRRPPPFLHFVCLLPISSDDLSSNLSDRDRVLWGVVRCTVVALWRSRLVGGGGRGDGAVLCGNRLTFLFQNGAVLTVDQGELVQSMAEQHQAAPSEYQILTALLQKKRANDAALVARTTAGGIDWKATSKNILKSLIGKKRDNPPNYAVDFQCSDAADTCSSTHLFYSKAHAHEANTSPSETVHQHGSLSVMAVLPLYHSLSMVAESTSRPRLCWKSVAAVWCARSERTRFRS